MAGRLAEQGSIRVRAVTLDSFVAGGARPPTAVKIDVEGAEMRLLQGAVETLRHHHPALLIDTHDFLGGESADLHRRCIEFLRTLGGYSLQITPAQKFAGEIIAIPQH